MFLVLIETSGNQNFIFSTNKLKENIGASELTYRATTEWLFQAVDHVVGTQLYSTWQKTQSLEFLTNSAINPCIEKASSTVEILLATSGKALILTQKEDTAKKIISHVTRQALINAPGLDIGGVFVQFDWDKPEKPGSISIAEAVRNAHKKFEEVRARRAGPSSRFLRLPIIASCKMSELPASVIESGQEEIPLSQVSFVKQHAALSAQARLHQIDKRLTPNLKQLETYFEDDKQSWLAVVHADGNGLGQILLKFEKYIGNSKTNRNYIDKYRKFSLALDECTVSAFKKALPVLSRKDKQIEYPIVPLILGGDDLTVICDGQYALEFTRVFLQEFEKQTQQHTDISEIAQKVFGMGRLSACAGISIIKQHFPFSVAYDLAEKLIKSAKGIKTKVTKADSAGKIPFPCSAIDFHILYESSGIDFETIRKKLQIDRPEPKVKLYNRPYVVTAINDLQQANGQEWAVSHKWKRLTDRVQWLQETEADQDAIPSSQSHAIRTSLYLGKTEADAQYNLIRQRYPRLEKFAEDKDKKSLFHQEEEESQVTSFLDALDAKDFFKNANPDQASGGQS